MTEVPISDADLQAFVDGRLDAKRRAEVEAYIAANPEAARTVDAYRAQNAALHAAFDGVLNEPLPEALAQSPVGSQWINLRRLAAAIALLVLGGAGGWLLNEVVAPGERALVPLMSERARVAHAVFTPEVRHPVEVVAAERTHLVAWLTKRIGAPLVVPELTDRGYNLVGGRLLPDDRTPAAQLMYEDDSGDRLTLYVRKSAGDEPQSAMRYDFLDGVGVYSWNDGVKGYALAGTRQKDKLLQVAKLVYKQLSR